MVSGPQKETEEGARGVQDGSLAAVIILSAPFAMVVVCIFSFLVGLAIYQGFVLTKKLDGDAAPGDRRDSFIALLVGTGMCTSFFLLTFSAKDIESTLRSRFSRLKESSYNPVDMITESPGAIGESSPERSSGRSLQLSSNVTRQENLHVREAVNGRQVVELSQEQVLANLLEAASNAHAQCAEADRRLAAALSNPRTT